ncbi:MAG: hypothetical protein JWN27_161 [Candidatus Eremiobacteraeota bacterium]|nr:hypothetical protein [Candidatus Eremiobacteraeota bacterium]
MRFLPPALAAWLIALGVAGWPAAAQAPQAPQTCSPEVNRQLADLLAQRDRGPVDGITVCGITIGPSRPQRAGRHGGHQLIPVRAPLPGDGSALIEVVTNDDLDGRVTAPRGATVIALGQYFHTTARQRPFVAGIHDVHCATHRGAANGYVIVNGRRFGCGA